MSVRTSLLSIATCLVPAASCLVLAPACSGEVPRGRLSWFGIGRKPPSMLLELRLTQNDPVRPNLLQVVAVFRTSDGSPATSQTWRAKCVQHYINLRGYLIGVTEPVG